MRCFIKRGICLLALGLASLVVAEEQPAWEFEVAESESAAFEAAQLHAKETGWLMTCRMRVKSLRLIAPISQLELVGLDAEDEVIWEKEHTVRRKDFEAAYGGGRSQFIRVLIEDVPSAVVRVELRYGDDSEESESE